MLTAILDTNVFVSSVIVRHGNGAQLFRAWLERRFLLVSSPAQLDELRATLSYARIRRRYGVTDANVEELIATITFAAVMLPGETPVAAGNLRDPDDLFLLSLAVESRADVLCTGDQDLLVLGDFEGTRIISPREFLGLLDQDTP